MPYSLRKVRNQFDAFYEQTVEDPFGFFLKEDQVSVYSNAIEASLIGFSKVLEASLAIPKDDLFVLYHTYELNNPHDLELLGKHLRFDDPRRNYIVPLLTNHVESMTSKAATYYTQTYWPYLQFSFLVDCSGYVYIRPFSTKELSSVTGYAINQ